MASKDFTFISPGVFTNEIDQSQYGQGEDAIGPAIIGRFDKGPGMIPTKVNSYEEFVNMFGMPSEGTEANSWRDGNKSAVNYGGHAAKAWLKNNSPVTIVRLLGQQSDKELGAGTLAGWKTTYTTGSTTEYSQNGGAFGLFIIASGSAYGDGTTRPDITGNLAAVWYLNGSTGIELSGTAMSAAIGVAGCDLGVTASASTIIKNTAQGGQFTVLMHSGSATDKISFHFDPGTTDGFIRNAFNTNPTRVNASTEPSDVQSYWLGETFENHLTGAVSAGGSGDQYYGIILSMHSGSVAWADHYGKQATSARTGWIISQDTTTSDGTSFNVARDTTKLFKFHTLNGDGWAQRNIKICIANISVSKDADVYPYARFDVEIRELFNSDTQAKKKVLEYHGDLNLDPRSPNYIAKVIGDQYPVWDDTLKKNRMVGRNANRSAYIRIEMADDNLDSTLIPFGFEGPARPNGFTMASGSAGATISKLAQPHNGHNTFVSGGFYFSKQAGNWLRDDFAGKTARTAEDDAAFAGFPARLSCSFIWPDINLVQSASTQGFPIDTQEGTQGCYFGLRTRVNSDQREDRATLDILRAAPDGINGFSYSDVSNGMRVQTYFTLDDVSGSVDGAGPVYVSGSRAAGTSLTAVTEKPEGVMGQAGTPNADCWANNFSVPLFGGTDGLDIREPDPFNNGDTSGGTELDNTYVYSLGKAIDLISTPEELSINMAAAPGITNTTITKKLVDKMEQRGDALAIVDLEGGYKPASETSNRTATSTYGSVKTTVSNLRARTLNSSYGCAYYPWVEARTTGGGTNTFYLPPSVAALAAISWSEKASEVWFAPAGFSRGGIGDGASKYGLDIVGTIDPLSAKDRDRLYEVNINPIANFSSEGIVIFGQKTLQVERSALDRINVRRLLIYLKRNIQRMAKGILFEQNVESTWQSFLNQVNPFLAEVKAGSGLVDYKVILDKTTTTPDLIDQNALYAKIIVKPAKSIEFILLDFVITNQGAVFNE